MRNLSIAVIAAAFTIALPQMVSAADLPRKVPAYTPPAPPPVFSWTGFYIGTNAGGHWDDDEIAYELNPAENVGANATALDAVLATALHPNGFIGGGQVGYNWQTGNFVIGLEGDVNGLTGKVSRFVRGFPGTGTDPEDFATNSTEATFLATLRGRLGWAVERTLFYVTGGAAWGTIKTTDTFGSNNGTILQTTSDSTTRAGWTVGGGVEYAFWNNFSIKGEYLYVDLGDFDTHIPAAPTYVNTDFAVHHNYTENIARVGLNYKF